jgi:CRP-like cAMP-binding protein
MVCADVSLEDLAAFHIPIAEMVFSPGTALFNMSFPVDGVHCVRHGAIKLVKLDAAGNQRIVRVLKKGDVAGLESAFAAEFQHSAVAVGEVQTCKIPIGHFRDFVAQHSGLQMRLLEMSQQALREVDGWLSELVGAITPARVRMARLMLRLRVNDSDRIHRFSIEDMGTIVGISPETVSRIVSEFQREGILIRAGQGLRSRHYRGDIAALTKVAEES